MALPNNDPIFSRAGAIGQSAKLTTAAADYTGVSPYNREVFASDTTNGGYCQRLRFKSLGTNIATVARIYINRGPVNNNLAVAPTAPTGTPATTGGTLVAGTYYAAVVAIMAGGSQSVIGAFSLNVLTTGATGSIAWAWTAVPGAVSYRLYISPWIATGATYAVFATRYVTSATNSYSQTAMIESVGTNDDPYTGNQFLYGEVTLPATTISAVAALPDIDYSINMALPSGYEIYIGLGTTVAAGWQVTGIGGSY
jgi:hypothetical protein